MWLNGYPEKLITKTIKQTLPANSESNNSQNLETPKHFIPYEKWISEQLKCAANKFGLEVIFTRSFKAKVSKSQSQGQSYWQTLLRVVVHVELYTR